MRVFFELDQRLGRIVAATTEPMLGQMRLAWWRDMLGKPAGERPSGDAVLDGIGVHWPDREEPLIMLVDGWEHMLAEVLDDAAVSAFSTGRAAAFLWLVKGNYEDDPEVERIAAKRWALVDAAAHTTEGADRDILIQAAKEIGRGGKLPRELRGLAILDALARRSLNNGCRPLMEGRSAALVATRAAIFGR